MKKLFYLAIWAVTVFPAKVLAGGTLTPTGDDITLENPLGSVDTIPDILNRIIDFLLIVAAPIAVIMTIYAAYLFITAGDNQEKVKTARKTLLYVIIGVAILILSKGIVNLVQSFLTAPTPPVNPPAKVNPPANVGG